MYECQEVKKKLYEQIREMKLEIDALKQRISVLEEQDKYKTLRIDSLSDLREALEKRVSKLEKSVNYLIYR